MSDYDPIFEEKKRAAIQAAAVAITMAPIAGIKDNQGLALFGAFLLAKATWAQMMGCSDPACESCGGYEVSDFRDEAIGLLIEAMNDLELIETQAEGRA